MNKIMIVAVLLMFSQLASARVYMCVDPATGDSSFTDKACDTSSLREEIRIDPTNLDSGTRYKAQPAKKTWKSQEDRRKTGLDYNQERRSLYESKATASASK